jgi:hypothetical protein
VAVDRLLVEQERLWAALKVTGDLVEAYNNKAKRLLRREKRQKRKSIKNMEIREAEKRWGNRSAYGNWETRQEEEMDIEQEVCVVHPQNGEWELPWLAEMAEEVERNHTGKAAEVGVVVEMITDQQEEGSSERTPARLNWGGVMSKAFETARGQYKESMRLYRETEEELGRVRNELETEGEWEDFGWGGSGWGTTEIEGLRRGVSREEAEEEGLQVGYRTLE